MKKPVILFFLWCYAIYGYAQDNTYQLREYNLPKGIRDQILTCVEKDQAGLLWFATNSGLYRYDGRTVIHLDQDSDPAISNGTISTLFADQQGHLWVGAQEGLTRLNLVHWTTTTIKAADSSTPVNIAAISQGDDARIYASTRDGKLYRVEQDSLRMVMDIWKSYPTPYNFTAITFISASCPGELWMGTTFGKLIRIRIKNGHYSTPEFFGPKAFSGEFINTAFFHSSGMGVLVVAHHGLFLFDTRSGHFKKVPGLPGELGKHGQVYMQSLNDDEVVIMTNAPDIGKDKLFIYNFKTRKFTIQSLQYPSYLKDNHLVWMRNTGQAILLSLNAHLMELKSASPLFKVFLTDAKALSSIRSIYKQPGGMLYAGSYRDGFLRLNEKTGTSEVIVRKYVYSILPWNKDSLLLGTEGDGLYWYEPRSNKLSPLTVVPETAGGPPLGTYITVLVRLETGKVLTGTEEGLYIVDPHRKTSRAARNDRLSHSKVFSLVKWNNDFLVGTSHGIKRWNRQSDSLAPFIQDSILQAKSGNLYAMAMVNGQIWAATDGHGIRILDNQGYLVDTLTNSKGLAGNIVFSLVPTKDFVFAGTRNGLSVINKKTKKIHNYSRMDQLPVNEFNSAATFRTHDTVYMGTINGIVRFNAQRLHASKKEPVHIPIHITDLTVAEKGDGIRHYYSLAYQPDRSLTISPDVRYFSIGFGGLDGSEKTLRYYYRLQKNSKWDPIGQTQQITFVGMSPGRYNLQLAAQLPDGHWTASLLSVPLIVEPAYYQTLWFKILVVLAVAAIVWGFFKYQEKQAEKERLLRLRIAGDLHDEVGSTLAGISMQADMLLSGRQAHLKEYLQNIATSGRSAVHTMGDIVWSIDPRNDDTVSLVKRLERYGRKTMEPADIALSFHVHNNNEQLYISQKKRQNIMLIFKEALINIAKHAAATSVNISYIAERKDLRLIIADNGRGLAEDTDPAKGHGMRNMQMRAEAIGAKLHFPATEKGLTIVLECRI